MFFVSLHRPSEQDEQAVRDKGARLGFNFGCSGSSASAPPLPPAAQQDGWWNVDHARVKIGYGRKTYDFTRQLLLSWGQFQLPWAQVQPSTPIRPGTPVCVTANVFGLWTAVPLQIVYKREGSWQREQALQHQQQQLQPPAGKHQQQQQGRRRFLLFGRRQGSQQRHGRHVSYAHACLRTHFLAGEERFRVEWDRSDDSVWYDIYTFSRPDHPLAWLGYPVVRALQQRFRADSLRAVARAASRDAVERSLDDETRARLELAEEWCGAGGGSGGGSRV